MSTGTILRPLANGLYQIPKGVVHAFPFSDPEDKNSFSKGYRLGDPESVSVEVAQTKTEIKSNEYGVSTTVAEITTETTVTLTMSLKQLSNLVRAASIGGAAGAMTQDAVTGGTLSTNGAGVYTTGKLGITNVVGSVDDNGTPVAAIAGTDFVVHGPSGKIEVLTDDAITFTYDAPAISAGDARFLAGIASGGGFRGRVEITQVNAQGVKSLIVIHDFEPSVEGARELISSGTDPVPVTLTGKCYPKADEPAGRQIGYEVDIT
jgi:hypothetical protein